MHFWVHVANMDSVVFFVNGSGCGYPVLFWLFDWNNNGDSQNTNVRFEAALTATIVAKAAPVRTG